MWLKDGEFLGKEKPGERYCSEVWESEGDSSLDFDFFFFLFEVVGSVSSEESTHGGPISFSDSFLLILIRYNNLA